MAQCNVYFSFPPLQSGIARQIGAMVEQWGYSCDYCDDYSFDIRTGKSFAADFDCLVYILDDMPRDPQDPYMLELSWANLKNRHVVPVKVGQPMLDTMSASQLGQRLIHVLPGMYGMNMGIQTVANDIQSKLRPAAYGNMWGMGGFGGWMPYTPTYTPSYTPPKPAPTLEERAAAGDTDAQVKLGDQCMDKGLAEDEIDSPKSSKWTRKSEWRRKAFEWYMKAAKAGNGEAMAKVAYLYRWGHGTDRLGDAPWEAAEWYKKAMKKGNLEAKARYAELCLFGKICFSQSREEGLRLMEEAIEEGSMTAKCLMVGFEEYYTHWDNNGWWWQDREKIYAAAARENNPEGWYRYAQYLFYKRRQEKIPDYNPKYSKEIATYLERAKKLHNLEAEGLIWCFKQRGWWVGI